MDLNGNEGEKRGEWGEVIHLIPQMQQAVGRVMKVHHKHHQDHSHLQKELEDLRPGIEILQGKFTLDLIFILNGQPGLFFNDIKNALPYINTGTLTKRLRELEERGIAARIVHPGQPVRVSYEITTLGQGIFQLLLPLLVFARYHDEFLRGEEHVAGGQL